MPLAPIAVFAYKRPIHLRRTIEALARCPLANDSELYVFADGPKGAGDMQPVAEVREVIQQIKGFSHVGMVFREDNWGLAKSIISGVTQLCNEHGQVIVVEDDLVVAPGFLTYMNQSLEQYKAEAKVMQISGYMFPIPEAVRVGDAFLCRKPASWGWATWQRAWRRFNPDSEEMLAVITRMGCQREFDVDGSYPYFEMLQQQAAGTLDVWGVRWYASMFLQGGLCLYPSRSLVSNIGMDGSGTHCDPNNRFDVTLSQNMSWKFPQGILESPEGLELLKTFALQGHDEVATWTQTTRRTLIGAIHKVHQVVRRAKAWAG